MSWQDSNTKGILYKTFLDIQMPKCLAVPRHFVTFFAWVNLVSMPLQILHFRSHARYGRAAVLYYFVLGQLERLCLFPRSCTFMPSDIWLGKTRIRQNSEQSNFASSPRVRWRASDPLAAAFCGRDSSNRAISRDFAFEDAVSPTFTPPLGNEFCLGEPLVLDCRAI
jgi:hypothetical protein